MTWNGFVCSSVTSTWTKPTTTTTNAPTTALAAVGGLAIETTKQDDDKCRDGNK